MPLNLIIANGPDAGRAFRLSDDRLHVIGRLNESLSVPVSDTVVSRIHAELIASNGCWHINDMRSTNGTFVNGEFVTGQTRLKDGDQIRIGRTLFVVDLPGDQRSTPLACPPPSTARVNDRQPDSDHDPSVTNPSGPGTVALGQDRPAWLNPLGWVLVGITLLAVLALIVDVYRHPG